MAYSRQYGQACYKGSWLYFPLGDSSPVLDHGATPTSYDTPHEIETPNLHVDGDITFTSTDSVDPDVEGLQLARDGLFGYLDLLKNNHPSTLRKVEKFVGLVKKLLDEASNLHITDFDFTTRLGASSHL